MAKRERAYYAPRSERGLSDRVFLDPSNRRKSRVLVSILTCLGALVLWFSLFAVAMVSNQGLRAALPNEIREIKEQFSDGGRLHPHEGHDHAHNQDHALPDIKSAAIETYWQQDAAKYRCQVTDVAGQGQKRIYAVVPSALPWAPNSLRQSCETVSVAIPEWFTLRARGGKAAVDGVNDDTRQPVLSYAKAHAAQMELMPKIALDVTAARLFKSRDGRAELAQTLAGFAADEDLTAQHIGFCLSADRMTAEGTKAFAEVIRPFGRAMQARGLQACVALPAGSPDALLVVANRFADKVIMRGYQQPWVGSAVAPLAAQGWFEDHITGLLGSIDADKLVVELGTHAVDWISGRPKPEAMPFAQVMTALADAQVAPEFDAESGNTRATYIDDKGLQHRIWMLDAASLHNQLQVLSERGVSSVVLGGLGSEDPGIWAVLDQAQHGVPFNGDSLANVVFTDFVQRVGKGPFVAPLSMPLVGERRVSVAAETGLITGVAYDEIPRASVAQLYGTDQPNKVVLTFDDGPHPEYTPEALDILKETNTPAAFFVLGTAALQSPALLERILDEGHELGSHTYSHPKMGDISASRATVEVNSVQLLVNGITGRSMRLYREPYMRSGGPITSKEVASLMPLEEAGYVIAGMDVVPRDWLVQTADELADEIIRQVEDNAGGIVLLHDGGGDQSQTVAALPKVITTLRDRGYEFASISEFLNVSPDVLMPQTDRVTSTFGNVSFIAVGKSWSLLEIVFWTVFGIGLFRALVLLILTAKRRRHEGGVSDEQPSVTIVIPAYNEERVIAKAVRRALATEYDNFDVIVVDDGSTDDTLEAAMAFADLPNVTVLTQPNGGKATALNTALDESDSEILICIDADSQVAPDAVALMAAHFEDPTIGAVAGRVVVGNRKNILTRLQALEYITAQSIERRAKEYLNAITVVPGAIGAWRATALMEAGVFSTETLTEDADMTMAVIRSDYRVIYEERAVATTETPARLKGLMEQRLRWSLGMMQAAWKHKGATIEGRKLGLVSIPDLAVFGYLMPLIAPLADLFLLILAWNFYHSYDSATFDLATLTGNPLILAYITLPVVEILTVVIAFRLDPTENRALMLLIPLQRLFYRQVLYISVIRALWRAATGSLAKWGRAPRAGFTFNEPRTT